MQLRLRYLAPGPLAAILLLSSPALCQSFRPDAKGFSCPQHPRRTIVYTGGAFTIAVAEPQHAAPRQSVALGSSLKLDAGIFLKNGVANGGRP